MKTGKRIKAIVVACMLSLALATPVFTPIGSVVPGSSVVSVQAKSGKLTLKQARNKLKNRIKKDGKKTKYTFKYMGSEDGYYVFFIYSCSGSNCSPVGYGEVHKKTGKIHYQFGV
ncbi:MAG: hypothetical protein VZQ83_07185 [Eubacterium sp.]|nr:hypothetical protein [Eubacterium sp.]